MNDNDSFQRWQETSLKQLGFTTNLILTINTAVLVYLIDQISSPQFCILGNPKIFYTGGFFILGISFVLGIVINITRLYDFRITAKIARNKSNSQDNNIESLRTKAEKLGKTTWVILIIQVTTFGLGLIAEILSFCVKNSEKLF